MAHRLYFGLLAALVLSNGACATMAARRNDVRETQVNGRTTFVDRVRVIGVTAADSVYVDGALASLDDPAALRQIAFYRELCLRASRSDCDVEYVRGSTRVLWLNRAQAHTIRVVRGDREATMRLRAGWKFKWFWIDGLLGPGAFVAWYIDSRTNGWRRHPSVIDAGSLSWTAPGTR